MSKSELSLLRNALDAAHLYLEFGSGGTTVEAAKRPHIRCVSVEADKSWIERLDDNAEVKRAKTEQRLRFVHADIGPVGRWSFPLNRNGPLAWENYCIRVWSEFTAPPDLVLIDGRFRLACCVMTFLACPQATTVLLHDFGTQMTQRANYARVTELGDILETSDTLVVLKKRLDFDYLKAVALLDTARSDCW